MDKDEIYNQLIGKIEILKAINTNTQTQLRFVHKRQTLGIQRLLREREQLIADLAAINGKLSGDSQWRTDPRYQPLYQIIDRIREEITKNCKQTLSDAIVERNQILSEIRRLQTFKKCRNRYQGKRVSAPGMRFNWKG